MAQPIPCLALPRADARQPGADPFAGGFGAFLNLLRRERGLPALSAQQLLDAWKASQPLHPGLAGGALGQ